MFWYAQLFERPSKYDEYTCTCEAVVTVLLVVRGMFSVTRFAETEVHILIHVCQNVQGGEDVTGVRVRRRESTHPHANPRFPPGI